MDIRIEGTGADCFLAALFCMTLPLDWLLAGMAAAAFHEICHVAVVLLLGGSIYGMRIGLAGAVLEASPMEPKREILSVLAGPVGSLFLLIFSESCPKTALCGFVHGMFNLLPMHPLDGGRILRCAAMMLFAPEKAANICDAVQRIVRLILMVCLFLVACFLDAGFLLAFLVLCFRGKTGFGKIPCKPGKLAVQWGYHL